MSGFRPPLAVHLCWFVGDGADPACAQIARELYELLHRPIDDDPVHRPGLEIPIDYGRDLTRLLDALERGESAAGARVVVVILDRAGLAASGFRDAVARAIERWPGGGTEVLVPIVVHAPWHDLLRGRSKLVPGGVDERRWQLGSEVAIAVGQALRGGGAPVWPQVFISHARADARDRAAELAAHFATRTRLTVWYDGTDVGRGDELQARLEAARGDGVLLVIRTDRYSESPWCGRELLAAKQARVPIVTVFDGRDGEPATSAYGGNHRIVVWRSDRAWEVVGRCVQAWLHGHHFSAHAAAALAHAGLPADAEIVARRPELIDLVSPSASSGRRIIVYPDPPLIEREAALLRAAQPAVRLVTPNTMLGKVLLASDPSPPLAGCTVGLSLSRAEELRSLSDPIDGSGLTGERLDDVLGTVVLTALQTGARIAYGGDFRGTGGYAVKLSDLHRARRRLGTGRGSQLICFVEATGPRAGDGEVDHWPVAVSAPAGADARPPAVREALWHLVMRDQMAQLGDGQIVLGGESRPATTAGAGYRGAWPGALEEAWRTLAAGKALYLLGGLGGCAGAMVRMLLDDEVPEVFTAAAQTGTGAAALATELDDARRQLTEVAASVVMRDGDELLGMAQLAEQLLDRWRRFCAGDGAAWSNGLDVEANRRLFRSIDRTEIAQLVFAGLRRIRRKPTDALALVLYHGDLASAADVDGYAVTATPGLPHAGALAALDRRLGGRLARAIDGASWREPIETFAIDSEVLAGRAALVARLPLPPSGSVITDGEVEALAVAVARTADGLGIEALAIAPFATSMGLAADAAVAAMIRGVQRGRGGLPRTLIVCETDPARYQTIRAALGTTARELRAGPRPSPVADTVVLQVDALGGAPDQPVTVRATAYVVDGATPLIPRHEVVLTPSEWRTLRERPAGFAATARRGRALHDRVLSPALTEVLDRHADRRLLLITNDLASGLPWEMLASGRATPAIAGGLVRRIAMTGARGANDRQQAQPFVRVLLVVDPTGDLPGAAAEGDEVAAALHGRPDVELTILREAEADRARVRAALATGHHDVLHYAGHAWFDAGAPGRSGLVLADGCFVAGDLAAAAPRLIVLGGCESARVRTGDAEAAVAEAPGSIDQPLAEALLRAGVSTLIGTFFLVDDGAACGFARVLHVALAAGQPVGAAVRAARAELHANRRGDWGNFVLYGDDGLIL